MEKVQKKNFKMVLKQETSYLPAFEICFKLTVLRIIFLISKTHGDKQHIIKKAKENLVFFLLTVPSSC